MEITTRAYPDRLVLHPAGRLVAGGPEFALSAGIRRAIDAGHRSIVVNLGLVSMLDAAGIGAIIGAVVTSRERCVSLAFEDAAPRVRTLLTLTGVWRVLTSRNRSGRRYPDRNDDQVARDEPIGVGSDLEKNRRPRGLARGNARQNARAHPPG